MIWEGARTLCSLLAAASPLAGVILGAIWLCNRPSCSAASSLLPRAPSAEQAALLGGDRPDEWQLPGLPTGSGAAVFTCTLQRPTSKPQQGVPCSFTVTCWGGFSCLCGSPFEGGSLSRGHLTSPWGQPFWRQGSGHFGGCLLGKILHLANPTLGPTSIHCPPLCPVLTMPEGKTNGHAGLMRSVGITQQRAKCPRGVRNGGQGL